MRPPIDKWLQTLSQNYESQVIQNSNSSRFEKLEVILNNLSLILFYLKETKLAQTLCRDMQDFFYKVYYKDKVFDCPNKFGVIQPWINLIRVDRFQGNSRNALEKLKELLCHDHKYPLNGHPILVQSFSPQSHRFMEYCYIDEKCKVLLSGSDFEGLKTFVDYCIQNYSLIPFQITFLLEIKTILMAKDEPEKVIDFLNNIMSELTPEEAMFFKLKHAHFLYLKEDVNGVLKVLNELMAQMTVQEGTKIYELRFWMQVADCLKQIGQSESALKICEKLHPCFQAHDDALSIYEMAIKVKADYSSKIDWEEIHQNSTYALIAMGTFQDQPWYRDALKLMNRIQNNLQTDLFNQTKQEAIAC